MKTIRLYKSSFVAAIWKYPVVTDQIKANELAVEQPGNQLRAAIAQHSSLRFYWNWKLRSLIQVWTVPHPSPSRFFWTPSTTFHLGFE